jgi:hypothetical protein
MLAVLAFGMKSLARLILLWMYTLHIAISLDWNFTKFYLGKNKGKAHLTKYTAGLILP